MIKLGVIFGGMSTENEVSVSSAKSVLNNLNKEKYEIYPIYISKEGLWYNYKTNEEIEPTQREQHKNNSTHHLDGERATVLISSVIVHAILSSRQQPSGLGYRVSTTPYDPSHKADHSSSGE